MLGAAAGGGDELRGAGLDGPAGFGRLAGARDDARAAGVGAGAAAADAAGERGGFGERLWW